MGCRNKAGRQKKEKGLAFWGPQTRAALSSCCDAISAASLKRTSAASMSPKHACILPHVSAQTVRPQRSSIYEKVVSPQTCNLVQSHSFRECFQFWSVACSMSVYSFLLLFAQEKQALNLREQALQHKVPEFRETSASAKGPQKMATSTSFKVYNQCKRSLHVSIASHLYAAQIATKTKTQFGKQ